MLCLLIGNIMLIGIVSGTPIYTQAAMQRILIKDMEHMQVERNTHPATVDLSYSFKYGSEDNNSITSYEIIKNEVVGYISNSFDIPIERIVNNMVLDNTRVTPLEPREDFPRTRSLNLNTYEGFEDYVTITHGRLPSNEIVDGNIIECIVNHRTLSRANLLLGELMKIGNLTNNDPVEQIDEEQEEEEAATGQGLGLWFTNEFETTTYYLRVVGVFETAPDQDVFWTRNPNNFTNEVIISHELMMSNFVDDYCPDNNLFAKWIIMYDYYSMSAHNVPNYLSVNRSISNSLSWVRQDILGYSENFTSTLEGYVDRTDRLTTTLLVLQVPIYIFLAFYIFIISRQILQLEQNDISVIKSRGVSRRQIIIIYLLQSLLISLWLLRAIEGHRKLCL